MIKLIRNITQTFAEAVKKRGVSIPCEVLKRGKYRQGYRPDIKGCYFRSSWEANIFRFFRWKGVILEYEPDIFTFKGEYKYGVRAYIPDFKAHCGQFTYYIEVKGRMDFASAEKIKAFSKEYPRLRLRIINEHHYNLIKKLYSSKIPNWE